MQLEMTRKLTENDIRIAKATGIEAITARNARIMQIWQLPTAMFNGRLYYGEVDISMMSYDELDRVTS